MLYKICIEEGFSAELRSLPFGLQQSLLSAKEQASLMLIDTHKAIKELQGAGVPGKEAEAIVGIVTRADEQVATKDDINVLKADVQALEERLTRRMYAMGFLIVAALGALNFFT